MDVRFASADREVLLACRAATALPGTPAVHRNTLRRGVRYRVLAPAAAPGLAGLACAGAEVRTAVVPLDALVVDGALAVLPTGEWPHQVAVFGQPGVVRPTTELFERVFAAAAPLLPSEDRGELTRRERQLLGLLVHGHTDEAAAARLRVSVRTVRRDVADLMDRLGARSRFQAGARAADRGWLLDDTA
ncbi:helix-turn-helix transcriptional regulator [Crossiella equi]|nr:helix-turn-helix transcriptional regulator [Crossiella equi]